MTDQLEEICNANNLIRSLYETGKGTMWKESVQRYEISFLENTRNTQIAIREERYEVKPYVEFPLHERGHERFIKSLHISDRVVLHSLCDNVLVPRVRPKLIYDNGASMKKKGISFARRRFCIHLNKYYKLHGNKGYIRFFDFSKFFDNIPHEGALNQYKPLLNPKEYEFVENIFKDFEVDVDNYIKIVCGEKFYGRYMDDFYIIAQTVGELNYYTAIIAVLCEEMGLHLNKKKIRTSPLDKEFVYLKTIYRMKENGRIVKRITKENISRERRKIRKFRKLVDTGKMTVEHAKNNYKSWRGSYKNYDSHYEIIKTDKYFLSVFPEVKEIE